ncbi:LOW QUALITY PROTEIN: splicing factor 1 [Geothlypis trichas]
MGLTPTPDDQNDLHKTQLQELARPSGTLQQDDSRTLRPWQNTEPRSITNTPVCTKCGGAGHIASNCKLEPGDPQSAQDKALMDKEYLSLMAKVGEAPVSMSSNATHNNSPLSSSHWGSSCSCDKQEARAPQRIPAECSSGFSRGRGAPWTLAQAPRAVLLEQVCRALSGPVGCASPPPPPGAGPPPPGAGPPPPGAGPPEPAAPPGAAGRGRRRAALSRRRGRAGKGP